MNHVIQIYGSSMVSINSMLVDDIVSIPHLEICNLYVKKILVAIMSANARFNHSRCEILMLCSEWINWTSNHVKYAFTIYCLYFRFDADYIHTLFNYCLFLPCLCKFNNTHYHRPFVLAQCKNYNHHYLLPSLTSVGEYCKFRFGENLTHSFH